MKVVLCALLASAGFSAAHAGEALARTGFKIDPAAQCVEDVRALWSYAAVRKSGVVAYSKFVLRDERTSALSDAQRARLARLAVLAYSDPRFKRFDDPTYVDGLLRGCSDPVRRFDPFRMTDAMVHVNTAAQ
ncbi:hypothetical protein [Burkholderia pseudomultivorans]|uniref:hypothetical protein n=1 Tax=Burkholderia pseudomultivorans TaxID=1207504 RepID=UPI0001FD8E22|nr:hypothetical protein [Burkholderia pseudomultivorans]EGD04124.1 hypothetical protein B1M_13000 [Burkholderia sp. TJI49]